MRTISKEKLSKALELHKIWANTNGRDGVRADLTGANLIGANLIGADLTRANLTRANLSGADLYEAHLYGANLSEANLSEANLRGADFSWACLIGADLTGANLSGADLTEADLSRVDLTGANLRGANLSMAFLTGANLSNAVLPTGQTLAQFVADLPTWITKGGKSLQEISEAWNCHDWANCPMHVAFGADNLTQVPEEYQDRAGLFVALFDGQHIPNPQD